MSEEEQVRRTLYEFCHFFENRRFDDWANLFAEDGVFASPHGECRGREEVRARAYSGRMATHSDSACQHSTVNPIIDITGDEATASSHLIMFNRDGGADAPWEYRVGGYEDRLVRTDGRWLFSHRRLYFF